MEAARDSIKGCKRGTMQQRVRTGERAGGMLVCSLVTMRVAVGGGRGGWKGAEGAEADGGLEGLHYASESGRDSYPYPSSLDAR